MSPIIKFNLRSLTFSLLLLFTATNSYASNEPFDDPSAGTRFVVIPGQNGIGGKSLSALKIIDTSDEQKVKVVKTPAYAPDFGQLNCQNHLSAVMGSLVSDNNVDKIIIHGTSQGTATALNYVAEHPEKVSALFLEAVMGSGNSAIHHTVKTMMMPMLARLPGSYLFLPYLAKIFFPFYQPAGQQSVFELEKIKVPVIIIHSKSDPQLAYDDAIAIAYGLQMHGNKNVYLFPIEEFGHVNLLIRHNSIKIKATINSIFKQLQLPYNESDLYSPTNEGQDLAKKAAVSQGKFEYETLLANERHIRAYDIYIRSGIYTMMMYMVLMVFNVI